MKFEIKIKPLSDNALWQGRRYKTNTYKDYEDEILWELPKKEMIKGPVEVNYVFHIKNFGRSDVSNFLKALNDIIGKKGYIEDDRKIIKQTIKKVRSKEHKIEIEIKKYEL